MKSILATIVLITNQDHPVSQLAPYSSNQLTDREPAMAPNRVQFQKGYSLAQFMDDYGTLDEVGTQSGDVLRRLRTHPR